VCKANGDGEQGESCTICLLKMGEQELGQPNCCEHVFCAECIVEWSRNVATCPIDRLPMKSIKVTLKGREVRRQRVKARRIQDVEAELLQEEPLEGIECVCEVCGAGDREETLLLCDACDLAYHMECLTPVLRAIPRGRWYCPTCERAGVGRARRQREVERRRPQNVERRRRGVEEEEDPTMGGFIVMDGEEDESFMAEDFEEDEDEEEELIVTPRTVRRERIERTVRHRRQLHAAASTPKRKRKVKRKTTRKVSKRKKKRASPKKRARPKKRAKRKKSRENESSNRSRDRDSLRAVGPPPLTLFGHKNDLEFYGDDPTLYANPEPSTSSGLSSKASTSSAVVSSSSQKGDVLSDIMTSQRQILTSPKKSSTPLKASEVYKRSEESPTSSKAINTSITKYLQRTSSAEAKRPELNRPKVNFGKLPKLEPSKPKAEPSKPKTEPSKPNAEPSKPKTEPSKPIERPPIRSSSITQDKMARLTEISVVAKKYLKPSFFSGEITREKYKEILGKVVEKVYRGECKEKINPEKVKKLVNAYVTINCISL